MNFNIELTNSRVKLRPIQKEDTAAFMEINADPSIWSFFTSDLINSNAVEKWVEQALVQFQNKTRVPFAIIDLATNKVVGSTSYGNISERDQRIEIGWTWLGKEFQGIGLNKHCKFLLLQYAFEQLHLERVEFKTDVLNIQSRKALLKIGATEEGILRSHTLMPENRRRDTIYFGILKNEWPTIKTTIFSNLS